MQAINFNKSVICLLVLFIFSFIVIFSIKGKEENEAILKNLRLTNANNLPKHTISLKNVIDKTELNCKMYNCFNIYKCGKIEGKNNFISVYLYPLSQIEDINGEILTPEISKEFYELYLSIAQSKYYTDNPESACLFIPPIDLLNQNNINKIDETAKFLTQLDYWGGGENNLIFNMLPGIHPEYSTSLEVQHGKAIVAGGGFSYWTYRTYFDVSIPVYSSLVRNFVDVIKLCVHENFCYGENNSEDSRYK